MTMWWLPGIAGVWTLMIWGSRVRLLTGDEAARTEVWVRIVASLVLGAAVVGVALIARNGGPGRWGLGIVAGFAVWMTYVWGSSAISVFTNDHSTGFRVVHTVLAAGSIGLAVAALVATIAAE